jgi:hypothetical protein
MKNFSTLVPAEFYAPTEKVDTISLMPGFLAMPYNEAAVVMHLPVEGQLEANKTTVNFCSKGYALIPNATIFPIIEEKLKASNLAYQVYYKIHNTAIFFITYVLTGSEIEVDGITYNPSISIQHSYNSQVLYGITPGLKEKDGENVLFGLSEDYIVSHCTGNTEKIITTTLDTIINYVEKYKSSVSESIALLTEYDINISELEATVEEAIDEVKFLKLKDKVVENVLALNKAGSTKVNYWTIYKGFVQELNENNTMQHDKRVKLEQYLFDYFTSDEEE